jgi:hypothetical protein
MIPLFLRRIFLVLFTIFLSGCSGYDRALLVTKTNVGLDIDTTPPTAEITIARREIAIQPTFPDVDNKESVLPLLGTFGMGGSYFNPHITGHFAGGDAAVYLTDQNNQTEAGSFLCLRNMPDTRSPLLKFWHFITLKSKNEAIKETGEETRTRPFYFATDTSYGVKVAWSGTGGPYPDSLKLGYNRKEFASPPIFIDSEGSCTIEEDPRKGEPGYKVTMPSFYASIDNASGFKTITDSGVDHVQFFATGKAASQFAKDPYVRKIAFSHMAPNAAKLKANTIGLNQELIMEIENAFNNADSTKKSKIMEAAKILKLVDEGDPTSNSFVEKLKIHSDSPDPEVSTNLIILRRVAVASPEKPTVPPKSPTQ